jgi:hypothetical protein
MILWNTGGFIIERADVSNVNIIVVIIDHNDDGAISATILITAAKDSHRKLNSA